MMFPGRVLPLYPVMATSTVGRNGGGNNPGRFRGPNDEEEGEVDGYLEDGESNSNEGFPDHHRHPHGSHIINPEPRRPHRGPMTPELPPPPRSESPHNPLERKLSALEKLKSMKFAQGGGGQKKLNLFSTSRMPERKHLTEEELRDLGATTSTARPRVETESPPIAGANRTGREKQPGFRDRVEQGANRRNWEEPINTTSQATNRHGSERLPPHHRRYGSQNSEPAQSHQSLHFHQRSQNRQMHPQRQQSQHLPRGGDRLQSNAPPHLRTVNLPPRNDYHPPPMRSNYDDHRHQMRLSPRQRSPIPPPRTPPPTGPPPPLDDERIHNLAIDWPDIENLSRWKLMELIDKLQALELKFLNDHKEGDGKIQAAHQTLYQEQTEMHQKVAARVQQGGMGPPPGWPQQSPGKIPSLLDLAVTPPKSEGTSKGENDGQKADKVPWPLPFPALPPGAPFSPPRPPFAGGISTNSLSQQPRLAAPNPGPVDPVAIRGAGIPPRMPIRPPGPPPLPPSILLRGPPPLPPRPPPGIAPPPGRLPQRPGMPPIRPPPPMPPGMMPPGLRLPPGMRPPPPFFMPHHQAMHGSNSQKRKGQAHKQSPAKRRATGTRNMGRRNMNQGRKNLREHMRKSPGHAEPPMDDQSTAGSDSRLQSESNQGKNGSQDPDIDEGQILDENGS